MRQIVFDTETTGFNRKDHYEAGETIASGHQIIEIGCVELVDRHPTGHNFHCYLKPSVPIDPNAIAVHGLDEEKLRDKPPFADIASEFSDYLQGADELIAHNASFDVAFLDQEFSGAGLPPVSGHFEVLDTLSLARRELRGRHNGNFKLDTLCKFFGVDNSNRQLHGALLDAQLLAEVYLRLTGGQFDLKLEPTPTQSQALAGEGALKVSWVPVLPSPEEHAAHLAYLAALRKS